MSKAIASLTGIEHLYFYDAIAPIVDVQSLDFSIVFAQSRYGKGEGDDYLNCPLSREQYAVFVEALLSAATVPSREFEKQLHFSGCMPIEAIAASGALSLAHGPLKPVGIVDPRTGERPFAVVQLRRENEAGAAWNLVGCQTKLTYPEQKRVFRMIPGLEKAEFLRLGSMHRNTFLNGPALLDETLRLKGHENLTFAGQITGVEGYVESAACGMLAGLFTAARLLGRDPSLPPAETAFGSLLRHVTSSALSAQQHQLRAVPAPSASISAAHPQLPLLRTGAGRDGALAGSYGHLAALAPAAGSLLFHRHLLHAAAEGMEVRADAPEDREEAPEEWLREYLEPGRGGSDRLSQMHSPRDEVASRHYAAVTEDHASAPASAEPQQGQ
jgi:hypothetical protein